MNDTAFQILERIKMRPLILADNNEARRLIQKMPYRYTTGCGRYSVEIDYPRVPAMEALHRLLEANEDCYWTVYYDEKANIRAVAFLEENHAVMFKLML